MDLVSHPFDRTPIPVYQDRGINHTKIKGLSQEMARENFINWNLNLHVMPTSSINLKPKTPDVLNLSDFKRVHPFVKTLFKETTETFPLAGSLKYFLKNWEKVTNDTAILRIVKGCPIDFVETPYEPRKSIRAKLN